MCADRGHGQNIMAAWPTPFRVTSHLLDFVATKPAASGIFDTLRLVHDISPNVLAEVSKKVERVRSHRNIEHQWQDNIIRLSLAQCRALVN